MKVWIDLSNSPHPLLFAPVARALEAARARGGRSRLATTRRRVELARERWPDGRGHRRPEPGGRRGEGGAARRASVALCALGARRARPTSRCRTTPTPRSSPRGSRAIPVVTAMDYEHQPANHLAFRLAHSDPRCRRPCPTARRRQGASAVEGAPLRGPEGGALPRRLRARRGRPRAAGRGRRGDGCRRAAAGRARAAYHRFETTRSSSSPRTLCAERGRDASSCWPATRSSGARSRPRPRERGRPAPGGRLALAVARGRPRDRRGRHDDARGGAAGDPDAERLRRRAAGRRPRGSSGAGASDGWSLPKRSTRSARGRRARPRSRICAPAVTVSSASSWRRCSRSAGTAPRPPEGRFPTAWGGR